ncbi:hypothetical protein UlMin_031296 [Ulmus minor]
MGSCRRLCDYCNESTALLYCRADSAKLCFSCDREVHRANQLFIKHTRLPLCDACDTSPASIFCSTESCILCQNCDWERHNLSVSEVHDRRPLEGFTGCPSACELLMSLGFDDMDKKSLFLDGNGGDDGFLGSEPDGSIGLVDGSSDFFIWDTPSVASLDDLIVTNSDHNFHAMEIPPLPKNRNVICGQHKEEILSQLRRLAKTEPNSTYADADGESNMGFQFLVSEQNVQPGCMPCSKHDAEPIVFPSSEAHACQSWNDSGENAPHESSLRSYLHESCKDPDKHSDIGDDLTHANDGQNDQEHPIDSKALSDFPKVPHFELSSQDRETAISRYKEKKKTRRYDKRIRYESRKVRAESRTRIKGRFAKMDN